MRGTKDPGMNRKNVSVSKTTGHADSERDANSHTNPPPRKRGKMRIAKTGYEADAQGATTAVSATPLCTNLSRIVGSVGRTTTPRDGAQNDNARIA